MARSRHLPVWLWFPSRPVRLPPAAGWRGWTCGLLALGLAGCSPDTVAGPALVVSGASLILTGRTPVDHVASLATGRDCSAVRLERRLPWCAPPPGPPPQPIYCTRSLGAADCWVAPPLGAGRQIADPPAW